MFDCSMLWTNAFRQGAIIQFINALWLEIQGHMIRMRTTAFPGFTVADAKISPVLVEVENACQIPALVKEKSKCQFSCGEKALVIFKLSWVTEQKEPVNTAVFLWFTVLALLWSTGWVVQWFTVEFCNGLQVEFYNGLRVVLYNGLRLSFIVVYWLSSIMVYGLSSIMVYGKSPIIVYGMTSIMVFGLSSLMAYRLSSIMDTYLLYALNLQLSKTEVLAPLANWSCCIWGKPAARESLYPTWNQKFMECTNFISQLWKY